MHLPLPAASVAHAKGAAKCLQVDELDLAAIGPEFEKNAVFPARINTEFVEVSQDWAQPRLYGRHNVWHNQDL